jgi:hypothetical protein
MGGGPAAGLLRHARRPGVEVIKLMDNCYKKWLTTFVYEGKPSTDILDEWFLLFSALSVPLR